jgi:hypothetical protein
MPALRLPAGLSLFIKEPACAPFMREPSTQSGHPRGTVLVFGLQRAVIIAMVAVRMVQVAFY